MLAAILLVGGLGGAAFHPPAAALVHAVSGNRKGLAMSTHISGGSLGIRARAAGVRAGRGRSGSDVGVAGRRPRARRAHLHAAADAQSRDPEQARRARAGRPAARTPSRSALLYIIVVLRTLTANSLSVFLPVLLTRQGLGVSEASAAVSLYLFVSTVGGFLGGPLADRYGARQVIMWSLVGSVPFLLAGQLTSGWTLTLLVSVGGFLLQSTLPVNVTFGQQLAPVSAATVSSLMMGFAWGVGSLLAPVVGLLGDGWAERRAVHHRGRPDPRGVFAMPLPAAPRGQATRSPRR